MPAVKIQNYKTKMDYHECVFVCVCGICLTEFLCANMRMSVCVYSMIERDVVDKSTDENAFCANHLHSPIIIMWTLLLLFPLAKKKTKLKTTKITISLR